MTFTELLRNVGLFGAAIMFCLVALSVFSVAVIVDKHRRFRLAARQSESFKPMFTKFLHGGDVQELIEAVEQHQNAHVAQVVSAGILEYDGVRQAGGDPVASLELVTSALRDSVSGPPSVRQPRSSASLARWPASSTLSGTSRPRALAECLWSRAASPRPW